MQTGVMKAAFLEQPRRLVIKEIPVPECSSDKVLIQIRNVGLCGSDLHYYEKGKIGDHIVTQPHILGHESSGVISKVGENVKGFKEGDRVAIEPGVPCNHCEFCGEGKYNLCDDVAFISVPPYGGAFAEYIVYNPHYVFLLPKIISLEEAALVEPLSVAYNAVTLAGMRPGDTVCILGAGAIGFACLEMSKAIGATKIIVADIDERKLSISKEHKADLVVNPTKTNMIEVIKEYTGGRGFDCVLEATGSGNAIALTTKLAKKGGIVLWIGLGDENVQISNYDVVKKGILIKGVYRYANTYNRVLQLLETRKIDMKGWISHRFPLEKIEEAVTTALDPSLLTMKIMIYMGEKSRNTVG